MSILIGFLIVLLTFILMECVSWGIHKYLFHGPLWFLHKSHHEARHGFLEWNDLFAILFAAISIWLMYIDRAHLGYQFCIGLGITLYGLTYFIVHDWFVHRRLKTFKSNNTYLNAVRRAHKIHHKNMGKKNGKAFGLLFVKKAIVSE